MHTEAHKRNKRLIGKPTPTNYRKAAVVARDVLRAAQRGHTARLLRPCQHCTGTTGWYCRVCQVNVCDACTQSGAHPCFADQSILPDRIA